MLLRILARVKKLIAFSEIRNQSMNPLSLNDFRFSASKMILKNSASTCDLVRTDPASSEVISGKKREHETFSHFFESLYMESSKEAADEHKNGRVVAEEYGRAGPDTVKNSQTSRWEVSVEHQISHSRVAEVHEQEKSTKMGRK